MSERLFDVEPPDERVRFLMHLEPFAGLDPAELERVAASVEERFVAAGAAVLIESGLPGRHLFVVREGTVELLHKQVLVADLTSGEIFGHPTLLTGLAPEFTARARTDCTRLLHPQGRRRRAAQPP